MRYSKPLAIFVTLFIVGSCARVVVKPGLELGPGEVRWAQQVLGRLSLEEKVGQMIACRYHGRFYSHDDDFLNELKALTSEQKIGGLIIFGGEVYETAHLTNTLQMLADVPLLIASDLERGLGNQIEGATLFPPLMSIGASDSDELAYLMGKITALEARAIGIHLTYAPVVDVNINPDNPIINTRSIGEDPELVSRLSTAFIRGCQENGLMATAKHFPGHGDTDLDSHSVLATIGGDRERLEKVELYPFRKAVDAGVMAIMTAHLRIPALDPTPNLPATLSPKILTGLLREEMGFRGIIVTDAMGMGGITTLYGPEEAALKAVKAGVDMVLLPPKPREVIQALAEAVRSGEIPELRINTSVRRILEAKARLGLHKNRLVNIEALVQKIGIQEHRRQAEKTFESSVTLVKNAGGVLPLTGESSKIAVFALSSDPGDYYAGKAFVQEMKAGAAGAIEFYAEASTGQEFLDRAVAEASEADVWVFALFSRLRAGKGSVGLDLRHVEMIRRATEGDKPVVVISFGSPYLLSHFPEVDAYLCAYRHADEAQRAAAKALFGEITISGRLPVSIPDLYPMGHGLQVPKKDRDGRDENKRENS